MRFKQILPPVLALGLAFGPMSAPVLAQQPSAASKGTISVEDARRIASENGMKTFKELEIDDGHWEVEGRDANGRELEIRIDGRTGAVLKIKHD